MQLRLLCPSRLNTKTRKKHKQAEQSLGDRIWVANYLSFHSWWGFSVVVECFKVHLFIAISILNPFTIGHILVLCLLVPADYTWWEKSKAHHSLPPWVMAIKDSHPKPDEGTNWVHHESNLNTYIAAVNKPRIFSRIHFRVRHFDILLF